MCNILYYINIIDKQKEKKIKAYYFFFLFDIYLSIQISR
jgi:hypothetical protein